MLKKTRNGMGLLMWIACILLCLVLLTVYLSKDLYAKYATGDRSGMEARVAGYGALTLTETGDFSPRHCGHRASRCQSDQACRDRL